MHVNHSIQCLAHGKKKVIYYLYFVHIIYLYLKMFYLFKLINTNPYFFNSFPQSLLASAFIIEVNTFNYMFSEAIIFCYY